MKESIKRIYDLEDLITQFFCYTNESGCQFIFSRYMLNMEGFVELQNREQIKTMFNKELYLQRLEDLGCIGYMVTPHQSVGYAPLGDNWGKVLDNLNAELEKDFTINPNPEGYLRESKRLTLKLITSRRFPHDWPEQPNPLKEIEAVEEKPNKTPWWHHGIAMTIGSLVILGLIYISRQYPSWFQ